MTNPDPPRILVVDDEEAILETMTFTFQDDYEVFTAQDARTGLQLLEEHQPVAAVLTDQRMPDMSGVEFVTEVWRRHPRTVRMVLTGFSDMEAIIDAINDGHVYAYITKPWEPDQLKQLMKQAVEYYQLSLENESLLEDLKRAKVFLESVMDELDTGALAVDATGSIQAANRPLREVLSLRGDPMGRPVKQVLEEVGLESVAAAAYGLVSEGGDRVCEIDAAIGGHPHRLRIRVESLKDGAGAELGHVVFVREISHEPLQRRFDDLLGGLCNQEGALREALDGAGESLRVLAEEIAATGVASPGVQLLGERISQTRTAIENWLDVDDALAREDFPDAQLLQDRMRVALSRWPLGDLLPERVHALARTLEQYYETGENPKQRVL